LARAKSSNPGWLLDLAVIDGRRGTDSINPSVPTVAELNAPGRQSGLTAPTCPSTAVPAALLTARTPRAAVFGAFSLAISTWVDADGDVPLPALIERGMESVTKLYAAGDMAGAVTTTFAGLGGQNWRNLLATAGPDAFDLAVRDTELFYRDEWPPSPTWTLDETRAAALQSPMVSVVGTLSGPFFKEGRQLLHQRFAQCTDADIPGVNHLMNLQAPKPITAAVADFLSDTRH
jgi:pimeloyl-ACP methyl ester carboxylesterase